MAGKKHPGFRAVEKRIAAKAGIPLERAGAILAASSRAASPQAKQANPRLNRVKGMPAKGMPLKGGKTGAKGAFSKGCK